MKEPTLGSPQNTIAVLQKYNFVFQKKFGQNFLIDTHVLDKIIRSAEITKDDFVLEIGPGIGTMTQYLACAAGKVAAVEIDRALIPILIPLFVSAFRRADELALAMECRCYRGGEGRTRMKQLKIHARDFWCALAVALGMAAVVLLNIWGGTLSAL